MNKNYSFISILVSDNIKKKKKQKKRKKASAEFNISKTFKKEQHTQHESQLQYTSLHCSQEFQELYQAAGEARKSFCQNSS